MAKIENTQAYPTVVPAMDDLLIATDVSNNNETVTFLVSSLIGGAGVLQGLQSVLDTGNTATQNINLTGDITVVGTVYPTTITAQATTGLAGQILSSTGTGIEWINSPATSCCSWNDSLTIGNTATTNAIVDGVNMTFQNAGAGLYVNSPAIVSISGVTNFNNTVVDMNNSDVIFGVTGQIEDSTGSTGTAGQWLTSQGPAGGVAWSSSLPPASCCGLQSTIASGNTSTGQNVTLTGTGLWTFDTNVSITSAGTNTWSGNNVFSAAGNLSTTAGIALTGSLYDGASTGTAGQVLTSTATGVSWAAPSAGTQDLQSVLDNGNTAGGANANITISGFIKPGQITDTSGATGAAGQVLTSTGTGLAWVTETCCNLQDTLTAGNSATTSIVLSGPGISLTAPTIIPGYIQDFSGTTGAPGEVLTVNGAGTGIEWAAPTGAVTSVSAGPSAASTGTPLTITPTTGAVVVTSNTYIGGTNVGHVPSGGTASTFLRGDGTWQTPSGSATAPEQTLMVPFYNTKWSPVANTFYTFHGMTEGSTVGIIGVNSLGTVAPSGGGFLMSPEDLMAGQVFGNPPGGTCTLYSEFWSICSVRFEFVTTVNTIFNFQLWNAPLCPADPEIGTLTQLAICEFGEADTTQFNCCDATVAASPGNRIGHGQSIFVTLNNGAGTGAANVNFQGRMYINLQKVLP
tara:strand:- start:8761 stop:10815 length:2055 start_codon:yes stop_codon:yes gene_type:complete